MSGLDIRFIHHSETQNIGDRLASPRHYFEFELSPTSGKVAIFGGGVFNDLAISVAARECADHRVLWAVGRSISARGADPGIKFAEIQRLFDVSSTRDPDGALNGIQLVPCVSVMHSICEIPPGSGRAMFFNADVRASGSEFPRLFRELRQLHPDLIFATNEMAETEYSEAFSRSGFIITNSYHTAYWALLSGRSVAVVGYSSKFRNLLRLMDLDENAMVGYHRGDNKTFRDALQHALKHPRYLKLGNAAAVKAEFRAINRQFVASLVRNRIFSNVSPKT